VRNWSGAEGAHVGGVFQVGPSVGGRRIRGCMGESVEEFMDPDKKELTQGGPR